MDPHKEEQDPNIDARRMHQQAAEGLGIPLHWPQKPLGGRAIGGKKGGKGHAKPKASHRAMRSSKSHPPKRYGQSPIGWE